MRCLCLLVVTSFVVFAMPVSLLAHGGEQRTIENTYVVNFSRSPFTPRALEPVQMLISFLGKAKNEPLTEPVLVTLRIRQLPAYGSPDGTVIFEQKDARIESGSIELPYIFLSAGFYELAVDFRLARHSQKVYAVPDYVFEVIEKPGAQIPLGLPIAGGAIFGILITWFFRRV